MKPEPLPDAVQEAKVLLLPSPQVFSFLAERLCVTDEDYAAAAELDPALARRDDPLVNLGLATYSPCAIVVRDMWERAADSPTVGVMSLAAALRVACLTNQCVAPHVFHGGLLDREEWLTSEEAHAIIEGDSFEEIRALLQNPRFPTLALAALHRTHAFAQMDTERWLACLSLLPGNRLFKADTSVEVGADKSLIMARDDVRHAVLQFALTAPVCELAMSALNDMLRAIGRKHHHRTTDIRTLLNRWSVERFPETEQAHVKTNAQWHTDFLARLAACLGALREPSESDLEAMRTSGDAGLTALALAEAPTKFGRLASALATGKRAVVIGALHNETTMLSAEARMEIDRHLPADLRGEYDAICSRLSQEYRYVREGERSTTKLEPTPAPAAHNPELEHLLALTTRMSEQLESQTQKITSLRFSFALLLVALLVLYAVHRTLG